VTAKAVAILPPVPQGGGEIAAAVMDVDRREEIPGAVVTWHNVDGGWRVEARIPWSALPGGFPMLDDRRGLALRLVDWDAGDREHAVLSWPSTLRPPVAPPAPPGPTGYDAPRLPIPWRPALFGEMRLTGELSAAEAEQYLPAFVPIGVDRSYYDGDEEVRVVALAGLGLSTAARLRVYAVDEQGTVTPLRRGDDWGEGAVAGASWTWVTPWDYAGTTLIVSSLEEPDGAKVRAYSFAESVGKAYKEHLERLKKLRERMMAAAVAPGSDTRRRRYIGSVLISLEEKESGQAAWRNYVVRADVEQLKRDLNDLEAQFDRAQRGEDPYAGRKGTYLRGYVSDIDDTLQHYSVAIPDAWAPGKAMPLIVNIHGYGFGQFLGHPAPGFPDAVSVACFGRGNGDYKLWCERDIITVMDAMLEDYGVDPDRVYITGGSMGGTGSWQMATLYPDRFAADAPTCGNANHRVWEEVWGWGQVDRTYITPYREWLQNTTSAFTYAENLRHVGSYAVHGTVDNIVPVGHARTMTDRLKNLGYDVVYEEQPGVGHGGFAAGTWERQKSYLMARSRDPWPKHVTFRTSWHRYPGAYWVRLERFREQARDARIDADIRGQSIRVQTTNLKRFSLLLGEHLVDPALPITVTVDDLPAYEGKLPEGGVLRLGLGGLRWSPCDAPTTLEKNANVGGPIEHVFMQRFLVVQGTTGDRLTNEVNRLMTEQLAEKWRRWGRGQRARVKLDYDVNDQDIADSNLVCFGGPDSNLIVRRAGNRLPVRIEDGQVFVGHESFAGEDVGIKLCYPNPLNPERYLGIFAGLTWKGTWDINGRFGNFFDWGIYDDRNYFDFAVFDAHTQTPETFLVSGYFDEDWGLENGRIIRGDEKLRAVSQPRRPPSPLAPLPAGDEVWLSDICPKRIDMEKGVVAYDSSAGHAQRDELRPRHRDPSAGRAVLRHRPAVPGLRGLDRRGPRGRQSGQQGA
ncbi:MAG: prolyl oligopeptidase family serine peptidase, partial [Armatimonadetes bacterium]|nr:prolyl oligopeptidase family serine peptidase [Armatimonadota bacterium]